MGVHSHLSEHRLLGSVVSLIGTVIHLDQRRFRLSIPVDRFCCPFVHRMMFSCRRGCILTVLICSVLPWPPVALSQEIDESEFSQAMLGYKLQLLKNKFEQTEMKLSTGRVAGSAPKKLEHVYNEMKCLEAEFRRGSYYPDLLDEQIVNIREELRLILADPMERSRARSKRRSIIVTISKVVPIFARLVLSAENELKQKKIIDIDARPFPRENKRIGTADTHSSFVGI
jgi:hypothetical protein